MARQQYCRKAAQGVSHELNRSQQCDAVPKKGKANAGCWVHDTAGTVLLLLAQEGHPQTGDFRAEQQI